MKIKWIGSPNFGYPDGTHGRQGYKPFAIVLHIAEGTLAGCDAWFNSPNNIDSSTQYCIGKNGEIHQYVAEEDAAWGNGRVRKPSWPLLIEGVNPNLYTISIEHEGFTGQPWTEEMLAADIWLIQRIARRWNIPLDPDHVIGHYRIDSVYRANCPGKGLPWDRLFAALNAPASLEEQVKVLQAQVGELKTKLSAIGRLVKPMGSERVYLLKNGVLYALSNQETLERLYARSLVEDVNPSEVAGLPTGPAIDVVPT